MCEWPKIGTKSIRIGDLKSCLTLLTLYCHVNRCFDTLEILRCFATEMSQRLRKDHGLIECCERPDIRVYSSYIYVDPEDELKYCVHTTSILSYEIGVQIVMNIGIAYVRCGTMLRVPSLVRCLRSWRDQLRIVDTAV